MPLDPDLEARLRRHRATLTNPDVVLSDRPLKSILADVIEAITGPNADEVLHDLVDYRPEK